MPRLENKSKITSTNKFFKILALWASNMVLPLNFMLEFRSESFLAFVIDKKFIYLLKTFLLFSSMFYVKLYFNTCENWVESKNLLWLPNRFFASYRVLEFILVLHIYFYRASYRLRLWEFFLTLYTSNLSNTVIFVL